MSYKEWKTYRFCEIPLEIIDGDRGKNYPKQDEFSSNGYCLFLNTGNVSLNGFNFSKTQFITKSKDTLLNKGKLKRDDVVLTTRGTLGNIGYFSSEIPFDNIRINSGMVILRNRDENELNTKYLVQYLKSSLFKDQVISFSSGSAQPQLPIKDLREIEITLPTVKIQQNIASILFSLDDKIELNRQTNQTLEGIAQTLFQEMCVPKGDKLPEGWRVGKLKEVVDIVMGQSPAGTSYNQNREGVIFFQGKAEFGFRFPEIDKYTTEPKRYANKLDTLLSVRAPVGTINMASERCCIGRGLAAISGKNNCWSYAFHLSKSLSERFEMYNGEGTVFGSINKTDLENLELIIPTKNVIQEFEVKAEALDNLVFTNEQENQTLIALRDSLLPKLMKGEIEI